MSNLAEAALGIFQQGFPVIPVNRSTKRPLVVWQGYQRHLPTEEQIKGWWARWPDANIGMITGRISGLVVVDADSEEATSRFLSAYPEAQVTRQAETGRGRHFYFQWVVGIRNDAGRILGEGIDVRGEGGFVILPPSLHSNGKRYRWLNENEPQLLAQGLRDALTRRSIGRDNSQHESVERIQEGERNNCLTSLAGTMRRRGMSLAAIEAALLVENAQRCDPPLPEDEVGKAARSVARYEPAETKTEAKSKDVADNPWVHARDVTEFLADEEKDFEGLAKDLLAPGAITLVASPRGIGKTQVSYALAVALATGGVFRGEQVRPVRVILVDRDNPSGYVRKSLRSWGAEQIPIGCLRVLTRENAPELKDKKAWEKFPLEDYEALIIDSVGSATEGITEKEGRETTQVLATILDLGRSDKGDKG